MESKADMLSRVCLMAEGSETWDLSDNDTRALRHVLAERNDFKQSSEVSALRIRELEAELAEARLDGARLDHVIDNFEYINFDGWTGYADYSAMDLGPEENEQAEIRKAWRKYIDAEMEAQ